MQARIQKIGGFLSAMVIPNIGAFIAWGLITALVIPDGWLGKLGWEGIGGDTWGTLTDLFVGPMITYLLPLLVAFTGGKLIHGHRGGVLGAIAVMGAIASNDTIEQVGVDGLEAVAINPPQFLGAMLLGPLAGYVMKAVDNWLEDRTPAGFEMLFNNFSQGILGVILAFLSYWIIGPVMGGLATAFGNIVEGITDAGLLPLADIPIEVAKVLFLNNALNHGVLTPLGVPEVAEKGRSIYFMLESNPGPGLGLLGAYWVAGKGLAKESAPGAMIVHFLGGIHEVYFPYVLMNPVMIGAMWAGGISADITFVATDAGLVAPASPGSIFAYIGVLPSNSTGALIGVFLGIAVGAVVAFVTGAALLKLFPVAEVDDANLEDEASMMPNIPGVDMPGMNA